MLNDLVAFLTRYPEGVESEQIITYFGRQLRTDSEKYIFRQMLRRVANLVRDRNKKTTLWVIKPLYQSE